MSAVCLIRVEERRPGSLLLSVVTTQQLSGESIQSHHVCDPAEVLPLVEAFLSEACAGTRGRRQGS